MGNLLLLHHESIPTDTAQSPVTWQTENKNRESTRTHNTVVESSIA